MESRFAEGCAWIDGDYLPIAEAKVPITDTGFSRSDCTYDVASVWQGRFFRLDAHLDRFARSLRGLRLEAPLSAEAIREILFECVRRSGLRDAYVDMIVTRGTATAGNRDPRRFQNRFYAYAIPYVWIVQPEQQEKGTHVVVAGQTIRIPPQAVDPTIKNFHWGDLVRGTFEAYERGGELAILPDADGHVTEGPGFNVFAVRGGVLHTPESGVLLGITRRTVLELAEEEGIRTQVGPLRVEDLRSAEEAFLTSTAGGVMPVALVDHSPLGDGSPGPLTQRLRQRYWDAHADPRYSEAVDYGDAKPR